MNKTKFSKIKSAVTTYQRTADRIFKEYNEKMSAAKVRYSRAVYTEKSMDIWAHYAGTLGSARDSVCREIGEIKDDIQADFRQWMARPVNADLLLTLDSLRNYGIKLSRAEIDVLKDEVQGSFFGLKILSSIAEKSGYRIKTPNITDFTSKLNSAVNAARDAVESYSGASPDFNGADLLGTWTVGGVQLGELPVWRQIFAANYLLKDTTLQEVEGAWAAANVPAAVELARDEQQRIYDLISDLPSEKEKKARLQDLENIEPGIQDKIALLSGEYAKAVTKYLDTGELDKVPENNVE